jgi:FixJ family two-component response regulator
VLRATAETDRNQPLVLVIDDDAAVCRAVARLLTATGYRVATYERGAQCLDEVPDMEPACILADIRMPEMDGIELSEQIRARGIAAPVVFMTATGDVQTVVRAMKHRASDLLPKPFTESTLLGAVDRAIGEAQRTDDEHRALVTLWRIAGKLTPREAEVCALVACGLPNKIVAARLGTTEKTIKVHRGRVMSKLAAGSLAELVRMVDRLVAAEDRITVRLDGIERARPNAVNIILDVVTRARTIALPMTPTTESPTLVR